jgi:hypothetical protein
MYYVIPFYMAGTTSRREAIGNLTEAAIEKWCLNTARSVLVDPYLTSARYLAHLFLDTGLTTTADGREYTAKLRCFPVTLKKQSRSDYDRIMEAS